MGNRVYYYQSRKRQEIWSFSQMLERFVKTQWRYGDSIQIICIGTDKVSGDSLGPFVGYQLEKLFLHKKQERNDAKQYSKTAIPIFLYGTLEKPVHAMNLKETIAHINQRYPANCTIVVDASLGVHHSTGYVTLSNGPLQPGEGVNKKLPSVGHIAITGIVGSAKGNPHQSQLALAQTRLYDLMILSDFIAEGIANSLTNLQLSSCNPSVMYH